MNKVYCKDCKFLKCTSHGTMQFEDCTYQEISPYNNTITFLGHKRENDRGRCKYFKRKSPRGE